jgi:hypothetical protein
MPKLTIGGAKPECRMLMYVRIKVAHCLFGWSKSTIDRKLIAIHVRVIVANFAAIVSKRLTENSNRQAAFVSVAQLVEQVTVNHPVVGSSPT